MRRHSEETRAKIRASSRAAGAARKAQGLPVRFTVAERAVLAKVLRFCFAPGSLLEYLDSEEVIGRRLLRRLDPVPSATEEPASDE